MSDSLDRAYFDRVYSQSPDPWNFATSDYERDKYAATIDALGARRFASGLEIGCSIGVLTALLAERCDDLLSIDINDRALTLARTRCAGLPNVRFETMTFPHESPSGRFELIVVSEVAYYWSDDDLRAAIDVIARQGAGATVELVHFLPKVDDYVRDGDAVHSTFLNDSRFELQQAARAERYRIDVLRVR